MKAVSMLALAAVIAAASVVAPGIVVGAHADQAAVMKKALASGKGPAAIVPTGYEVNARCADSSLPARRRCDLSDTRKAGAFWNRHRQDGGTSTAGGDGSK